MAAALQKTEAELRALNEKIDRMTQQVSRDALERERQSAGLRSAEMSLGQARGELSQLNREYADRSERRTALGAGQGARREQALIGQRARQALAGQLRAAYMIGREEPLKLLLNQQDPLHSGRLYAYYSYFGRARAEQIGQIQVHVQRLDALDADLAQQQQDLSGLQKLAQQTPSCSSSSTLAKIARACACKPGIAAAQTARTAAWRGSERSRRISSGYCSSWIIPSRRSHHRTMPRLSAARAASWRGRSRVV